MRGTLSDKDHALEVQHCTQQTRQSTQTCEKRDGTCLICVHQLVTRERDSLERCVAELKAAAADAREMKGQVC